MPKRVKFFLWTTALGSANTYDSLKEISLHFYLPEHVYVCKRNGETLNHIFRTFRRRVWEHFGSLDEGIPKWRRLERQGKVLWSNVSKAIFLSKDPREREQSLSTKILWLLSNQIEQ